MRCLLKPVAVQTKNTQLHSGGTCFNYAFFCRRIWKLAAPKAKAKPKAAPKPKTKAKALPAPEPSLDMQKAYKARAAAPGGRAASSWPLTGGRYPLPLFGDAEPECVLGWAMISLATQGSAW